MTDGSDSYTPEEKEKKTKNGWADYLPDLDTKLNT